MAEDEGGDALGLRMGGAPVGGYNDGPGLGSSVSMGGDEESVPLARAMDIEAVSFFSSKCTLF